MKFSIRLIILSLSFSLSAVAQNNTLQGTITDSANNPMEMVSVALLAPADSALVHFSVTNAKGQFVVKGISSGEFLFQASFIGFQTLALKLVFEEKDETRNLGTLIIEEQKNVLSEVIVQGERIPIIINKDTVSYDPTAFTVRADENVEDLLKRLPGVEVDPDGRVTAQGQEVKKVLVDGKEFFGGNVQIATQNLPADAIKKIKFYDRKSEDAMYTGVDDGQ